MTEINRYNFVLSSDCRTSGTNENPIFNLQFPISVSNKSNYFEVEILNPVIPFSMNMINSPYNTCTCDFIINSITYPTSTLVIPDGNYNILELMSEFKTQITNSYNALSSGGAIFNIQYDPTEGFVDIIIQSLGTDSTIVINFNQTNNFILTMIGFTIPFYVSYVHIATSDSHYNVCPVTQMYLRSESLLSRNFEMTANSNVQKYSDIIAILNLTTSFDSYIINTTLINLKSKCFQQSIFEIDLKLTSSNLYVPINLRGIPWSCVILLRELVNINSMQIQNYIPLKTEELIQNSKNNIIYNNKDHGNIKIPETASFHEQNNNSLTTQEINDTIQSEIYNNENIIPPTTSNSTQEINDKLNKLEEYENKLKLLAENFDEITNSSTFKNS